MADRMAFINEVNNNQPSLGCVFEVKGDNKIKDVKPFLIRSISIPSSDVSYLPIHWCGTAINIPISYSYGSNLINMTILADRKGVAYSTFFNLHNNIVETGAASNYTITVSPAAGYEDDYKWVIHDIGIMNLGEIELSQDNIGFLQFNVSVSFSDILFENEIAANNAAKKLGGYLSSAANRAAEALKGLFARQAADAADRARSMEVADKYAPTNR